MKIEINIDDRLIKRIKNFFSHRKIIVLFTLLFVMSIVVIKAADFTLNIFQPGTPILSEDVNENFQNIYNQIDANTMPGTIIAYGGSMSQQLRDRGWLECNGAPLRISDYPLLYAAIGTRWGNGTDDGDATTEFNLPDLRGRFLRGVAGSTDNDPDKSDRTALKSGGNTGNNVGSYQEDIYLSHDHMTQYSNFTPTSWDIAGSENGEIAQIGTDRSYPTTKSGGNETRPKNAYIYYLIKAR